MLNKRSRSACTALAVGVTVLASGCGTSSVSTSTDNQIASSTASPTPPNPFTIVARWSAAILGLSFGMTPDALAVGPDGNLYVTDLSQRVTEISPDGHVLRRWGGLGTGPGKFHFVSDDPSDPQAILAGIAVDSRGNVYVSDSGNERIQVFTRDGGFIRQFGSSGYGPGHFLYPFDLAVDDAGNVFVLDQGAPGVVNKFSSSGEPVWQVGGADSSDPDLRGYLHLTSIDQHGRLVMVNEGTGVVYLDENGHKIDAFDPGGTGWCEVSVDALGTTFLNGCGPPGDHFTLVFDRTHTLVGEWGHEGLPIAPLAIAPRFGPNGEVFALGWDGSVLKLKITLPQG